MLECQTMMDKKREERETARRRDEALRRALHMPPKPHSKGEAPKDRKPKGKREK